MTRKRKAKGKRAGVHHRSGYEAAIRKGLDSAGVQYEYEGRVFGLMLPGFNHHCVSCGSSRTWRKVRYTPDFLFPNGLVVEAKGKFTARDRKIAIAWLEQYPSPYGMMFQRDNKLSKTSKTRYSDWCKAFGIKYTIGTEVPKEWLK